MLIEDVGVRQFFNLTKKDVLYYLVGLNIFFASAVGFGVGVTLGENLIYLPLYLVAGFLFLIFTFIELRFLEKYERAHQIALRREKQILQRNKRFFVTCEFMSLSNYWLVIIISTLVFLSVMVVGVYRTKETGMKNFNEMSKDRQN